LQGKLSVRFYDSGFHTITLRAALPCPAPVNPKGMFKENFLSPLYPFMRPKVPSGRQHFCVPRVLKMFSINREGRAEGKKIKERGWFLEHYYFERSCRLSWEIQSSRRKFHLFLIYFGLWNLCKKKDPLNDYI